MIGQHSVLSSKFFLFTFLVFSIALTSCSNRRSNSMPVNYDDYNNGANMDFSDFEWDTDLSDLGRSSSMLDSIDTPNYRDALEDQIGASDTAQVYQMLEGALTDLKDDDADLNKTWKDMGMIMAMLAQNANPSDLADLSKNISKEVKKLGKNPSKELIRQVMAKILNLLMGFIQSIMSKAGL